MKYTNMKKKPLIQAVMVMALLTMFWASCSAPPLDRAGEEDSEVKAESVGYIRIGGGGTAARTLIPTTAEGPVSYKVTLENLDGLSWLGDINEVFGPEGGTIQVVPGNYAVSVRVYNNESPPRLRGMANQDIEVRSGSSHSIAVKAVIGIWDENELKDALEAAASTIVAGYLDTNMNILVLENDMSLDSTTGITVSGQFTLIAEDDITLSRAIANPPLFTVSGAGNRLYLGREGMAGTLTIDGGSGGSYAYTTAPLLQIQSGGTAEMSERVTLQNSWASSGGAVLVHMTGSAFTMKGGIISGNTSTINGNGGGGGVDVSNSGTFTMDNGTISNNATSGDGPGGGVYIDGGTFIMNDGAISDNAAAAIALGGGGVYLDNSGTFTMNSGTISDNTSNNGGGVLVYNGTFTMNGGTISDNTASGAGSGLGNGGGVYVNSGTFFLRGGEIRRNKAETIVYLAQGGGIYCNAAITLGSETIPGEDGMITLGGPVIIDGNEAVFDSTSTSGQAEGGGIYFGGSTTLSFTASCDVTINGNKARNQADDTSIGNSRGGGICYDGTTAVTIPAGFTITNNHSTSNTASFGGVYHGGQFTFDPATVWGGNRVDNLPGSGYNGATATPDPIHDADSIPS
jgi:hypothetical protein